MQNIRNFFGVLTALLVMGAACSSVGAAEPVVIKYSRWLPVAHPIEQEVMLPWAAEVEKVTQGRVRIEFLPKMVGTVTAQYDVVFDGLADMSVTIPGYTPGRFPAIELGELPLIVDDSRIGSSAFYRFYEKHLAPLNMFKGVHVLSIYTTSAGHIFTVKQPIARLSDLRGLKLRSPLPGATPTITAMGAVPVTKPVSELYEALSTGVLDGSLSQTAQAKDFKLADVTRHITKVPGGLYNSVLVLAINEGKWKTIAPADQKAIMKISGEAMSDSIGRVFYASDAAGEEMMRKAGGTVTTASPALLAEIKAVLQPLEQATLDKARKAGLADPAAALADYRADVERARKKLSGR